MWEDSMKSKKNTKGWTGKLRQAIYTFLFTWRFNIQKMKLGRERSAKQWEAFMKQAGICAKCWNHSHLILLALSASLLLGCSKPSYAQNMQISKDGKTACFSLVEMEKELKAAGAL